jgi:hypothetical protein
MLPNCDNSLAGSRQSRLPSSSPGTTYAAKAGSVMLMQDSVIKPGRDLKAALDE